MAFTKAFYEQAFERNLKAQQQKPETMASSGFAASSAPSVTQTQRATMQFTAYSKKEVVRDFLFLFSFVFCFLLLLRENPKM